MIQVYLQLLVLQHLFIKYSLLVIADYKKTQQLQEQQEEEVFTKTSNCLFISAQNS